MFCPVPLPHKRKADTVGNREWHNTTASLILPGGELLCTTSYSKTKSGLI